MRVFHRAVATALAGLAITAAAAVPAAATPEDGKGCVGSPTIPESYVCVISLTPENALPTYTLTNVPVTVPEVCYFLDCAPSRQVNVPVPNLQTRDGVVAVLWYRGQYIPIAVGTGPVVQLLNDSVDLATELAGDAQATAGALVGQVTTTVGEIRDGLPSAAELRQMVLDRVAQILEEQEPTIDTVRQVIEVVGGWLDDPQPLIDIIKDRLPDNLVETIMLILDIGCSDKLCL